MKTTPRLLTLLLAATLGLAGCATKGSEGAKEAPATTSSSSEQKIVIESNLGRAVSAPEALSIVKATEADSDNLKTRDIVYFDFDKYDVKPEYRGIVEAHARTLRSSPESKARIEGHTDSIGSSEYNLALGQRRSEAVRKMMVILGVPESQVEAVSFGLERPAVPGSDAASRAKNRRAEIRY